MANAPEDLFILPACEAQIDLLYTDSTLLLINKPSGLLSVPGRHPRNRDSVIARLQTQYPSAAIVHRLDFDTSGVMVVPLTRPALSQISRQFQQRQVEKVYVAVVQGEMQADEGEIDLPIAPDLEQRPKYKVCTASGKASLTRYRVLERDSLRGTTRVELFPVTGRSHQLRLHLHTIGHPILGCSFYHSDTSAQMASRLLLHACELRFIHPLTGEHVAAKSAAPF